MHSADMREPGTAGHNLDGTVIVSVAGLAEAVIEATHPDQGDLLASVTAAWRAGDLPGRTEGWFGGAVGSGVSPDVTASIIYPLLTGTLAQVLGTAAIAGSKRWQRPAGRHARRIPDTRIMIETAQIEALRSACMSRGPVLGLTAAETVMLADGLEAALRHALDGSQDR
jgi:hypothetical protein